MSNKYSELKDMLLGKFDAEEIQPLDVGPVERLVSEEADNTELVSHPAHYNYGKHETIDIIEDWQLGFHCGNAIKYISRHKHKGTPTRDIEKAIWYLQRYLQIMEK